MGNCCQRRPAASNADTADEDIELTDLSLRVGNNALDALITLGEVVPILGSFFELMGHLRDKWQALVQRNDEAQNVVEWAQQELDLLNVIKSRDERNLENEASRRLLQLSLIHI